MSTIWTVIYRRRVSLWVYIYRDIYYVSHRIENLFSKLIMHIHNMFMSGCWDLFNQIVYYDAFFNSYAYTSIRLEEWSAHIHHAPRHHTFTSCFRHMSASCDGVLHARHVTSWCAWNDILTSWYKTIASAIVLAPDLISVTLSWLAHPFQIWLAFSVSRILLHELSHKNLGSATSHLSFRICIGFRFATKLVSKLL